MKRLAKMTKATSSLRRSSAGATPSSPAGEIDTSHTITATRVPPVKLALGATSLSFVDGEWQPEGVEGNTSSSRSTGNAASSAKHAAELATKGAELERLQKENEGLRSEANLLKFKVELLVDMVTLANLDCDKLSDELEQKEKELGIG